MTRSKSTYLALLAVLLSPMAANAVPIVFTFTDTVTAGGTPGVSDGDTLVLEVIADNGGSGLLSQSWFQVDVISAMLTVGTYEAVFNFPFFSNDPSFMTDGAGNLTSAWYDIDGGNTDNLGAGSPGFFGDAVVTSIGTLMFYQGGICFAGTDCEGRWTAAAVPEPGTLALLGIGLLGMGAARRRKKA